MTVQTDIFPTDGRADVARVFQHLDDAERRARDARPALDPLRRLVRELLLDELARYKQARRYPQNRDFDAPTPYFVDAEGTRCAMAHLLEAGGEHALVARIARERNHAYVRELADEARLLAWLDAAGLTVQEAAAIQPAYNLSLSSCVCGGYPVVGVPPHVTPVRGVLEATWLAPPAGGTRAMLRIDRVHGDGGGRSVGDQLELPSGAAERPPGTEVLVTIASQRGDGGAAPADGVYVMDLDDGAFVCGQYWASGVQVRVPKDVVVSALRSNDCHATLAAHDPLLAWRMGEPRPRGGCSVVPGPHDAAPTTLGILLALLGVLIARRSATRSSRSTRSPDVPARRAPHASRPA